MGFKILIGYDGSEFASAAIADLIHAGLPTDAEALVLTGADVWPAIFDGDDPRTTPDTALPLSSAVRSLANIAMDDANALARSGAERVGKLFPGWAVTYEAVPRSPARALIERSETWKPDLLVVGGQGRSAVAQLIVRVSRGVGSVAQTVVRSAACSVRIGRVGTAAVGDMARPVRLIVGIDGSNESATALAAVTGRQWPAGSEVKVIVVLDLYALTSQPESRLVDVTPLRDGKTWARSAVDRCAEELRDAGVTAIPMVLEGDAKYVLIQEADEWHADSIFVGAHGMSRIERFMLGSVSSAVAERAHCSVEVVRHPASHV